MWKTYLLSKMDALIPKKCRKCGKHMGYRIKMFRRSQVRKPIIKRRNEKLICKTCQESAIK